MDAATIAVLIHISLEILVIMRVILRPHREPTSRLAWIVVVVTLPVIGILAYLLLGEVNIGRRRVARMQKVIDSLPKLSNDTCPQETLQAQIPDIYDHLFRVGRSISGYSPVGGNSGQLLADSNTTINRMVEDIDSAQDHVHLLFYIWLPDQNGCKIIDALKRAAERGVKCRAMVDGLGSRILIKSPYWNEMTAAGIHTAVALPIGNPLLRPFVGRIDLRNHRKIVVIDHNITYCGSQNCADPEFRIKPRYAPWVDAVIRFQGPVARQNQHLFISDWMTYVDEDLSSLLSTPITPAETGLPAQVVGTGPTVRYSAMPELFESLIHSARRELVITTPYYVPNESMQDAICATAYRGIDTKIIFPARNDSRIVGAASHSYYEELLQAGVKIYEYEGGLLHTKSLTLDGDVTLIGSANMDRRSFDLNYENNILFYDPALTQSIRERQQEYMAASKEVTAEAVAAWSMARRLKNNAIAMLGPVL
ncbi:cardiolipin synthase [Gimesia sp.]|uniref:cardiolipin synthase n=1 Tax=Gimesia sp. TaxID=2024833 RepID=UPI0025B9E2F3|nr:cardiolipin synthase [Gimesia sp.]|tara:strand:+ start:3793 stop:5232 length:1440 start_codon:yes stop_codon:yes gene_type:complete